MVASFRAQPYYIVTTVGNTGNPEERNTAPGISWSPRQTSRIRFITQIFLDWKLATSS